MDRRDFLKRTSKYLALGGLAASAPASALIQCSPFNPRGVQFCRVGIGSHVAMRAAREQPYSQWCWAACIESVFRYYGYHIPQHVIVQQTWGRIVNMPGTPQQILANLNRPWRDARGRRFNVYGDVMSANPVTAAQDLANNMPLIIGTMSHAMVLTSVEYARNRFGQGQVLKAIVRDPWPGRGRRILSAQEWYSTTFLVRIRVRPA